MLRPFTFTIEATGEIFYWQTFPDLYHLNLNFNLLLYIGGWSLIGLEESETWDINSTTGFIFEKVHGSYALFDISFSFDDFNSSRWIPTVGVLRNFRDYYI